MKVYQYLEGCVLITFIPEADILFQYKLFGPNNECLLIRYRNNTKAFKNAETQTLKMGPTGEIGKSEVEKLKEEIGESNEAGCYSPGEEKIIEKFVANLLNSNHC